MRPIRILVIHPEKETRDLLTDAVSGEERVIESLSSLRATTFDESEPIDLLLVRLESNKGIKILQEIKARFPSCQITLILPQNCHDPDRVFFRSGARHFFFEPVDPNVLKTLIGSVSRSIRRRWSDDAISSMKGEKPARKIMVGKAPSFLASLDLAARAAPGSSTTVLLLGENGTGKGTLARLIHEEGEKRSGPFVEVNCAAIPKSLMESEFFGHEAGAFTDAKRVKIGLFELASGGTIFLDEVGEIDVNLQAKLLKFLDSKMLRRIGGAESMTVDTRIIAATNQDLKTLISQGGFRKDLYYRLAVVEITLPPLRDRLEDIKILTDHFVAIYSKRFKKGKIKVVEDVYDAFRQYPWPGNVRELMNLLERAILLNQDRLITMRDLPAGFASRNEPPVLGLDGDGRVAVSFDHPDFSLIWAEKRIIESALEKTNGNVLAASRLLGIGRGNLRYKMKKFGIPAKKDLEPVG